MTTLPFAPYDMVVLAVEIDGWPAGTRAAVIDTCGPDLLLEIDTDTGLHLVDARPADLEPA